ncbi:MAG: zinc-ribbon domain-containing protein, partial [Proteobacteria bacterium]|nr:zinc-ribbon domain-containing protein [Pseudomonadota bacterium]
MDITCEKCNGKFRVSDEKIPAELKFIACPKCKNKIPISTAIKTEDIDSQQQDQPVLNSKNEAITFDEDVTSDSYDAADKPFDFIEEEGKTALVCESDPEFIKIILEALNLMEFTITVAKNGRDVMKKMRYHVYDTIVLNEKFDNSNPDANPIMFNLERLPIATRR